MQIPFSFHLIDHYFQKCIKYIKFIFQQQKFEKQKILLFLQFWSDVAG